MKKVLLSILLLAGLLSCTRDYNYIDYGFDGNSSYTGAYTRAYIQQISDNLIIQNLQAMEKMLALYDKEMWVVNSEFALDNEVDIQGVVIRKASADSTWVLSRNGDYPINDINFPTSYTITVRMTSDKVTLANHYNWILSLEGERTEDKGFACSFSTDGTMSYKYIYSSYNKWNSIYGKIVLYVTKDGEQIDKAMLEFKGDPANPFYANLK